MIQRILLLPFIVLIAGCSGAPNETEPKIGGGPEICAAPSSLDWLSAPELYDTKSSSRELAPPTLYAETQSPAEPPLEMEPYETPTELVAPMEWPRIFDDLDFAGMDIALERQLERFQKMPPWRSVVLGNDKFKISWVVKSLNHFKALIGELRNCRSKSNADCDARFEEAFKYKFNLYRPRLDPNDPRYGLDNSTLFTAYYTPKIKGSTTRTETFKYPIFRRPATGHKRSRVEIDFEGALNNRNLEVFYTDDLFSLYLMHVEGGGYIEVSGDSRKNSYLTYDGTNGLTWNFISKYMRQKGYIENESIYEQRKFLSQNPHRQKEIYASCPSYVYFRKSTHEPLGSDGVELSENRSLATDDEFYKFKGLLTLVVARRPDVSSVGRDNAQDNVNNCKRLQFKPFTRFYLDQDTGGAITGKARADLYFGKGEYAELSAHNLVQMGKIFFVMMKPKPY